MSHPVWVRGLKPKHLPAKHRVFVSHPVWVRGLKPFSSVGFRTWFGVAPRVGAWIETSGIYQNLNDVQVAPRVGAWIETKKKQQEEELELVAPRVGAWIETCQNIQKRKKLKTSHPVWVRGLKHRRKLPGLRFQEVAPRVGAWIETSA